ncbi:MAG: hypothetical protein N2383_13695 [Caldilineales bacterium]|nr:hypothetical protein [Caldilineales bacterium]
MPLVSRPWWQRSAWQLAFTGAVVSFLVTAAFLFVYREVNLDEGWYLWAARLVYEGQIPYRDFAYPQAPLLPYVYGLFRLVWGQGLYQGRLTTLLLAVGGLTIGYRLTRRRGGAWAGVLFLWLQTTTLVAATYTVAYTAPYALASALLLLAFHQSLDTAREDRRNILATVAMVAAAATRLSAAAGWAVFLPYLVYSSRQRKRALVRVALTTGVTGGLLFGPFLALGGEVMLYDVFGFHTDRMIPEDWPRVRLQSLHDTLRDFGMPFSLMLIGLIGGGIALARARSRWALLQAYLPELAMGLTVLALFVAHLLPRTTMSFYHSLQMPLVAVLGSLTMVKLGAGLWRHERTRPLLVVLVVLFLAVHAGWQFRRVLDYELVRWPPRPHIAVVRAAARSIERLVPPGSTILTFATPLVVETDLRLLPGYEMSIFAYRPTWSTAEAQRYRVVNNDRLQAALAQPQPIVALTTYDLDHLFYGERERILATLYRHYRWVKTVPDFGPLDHELRVFLPPRYDAWPPETRLERRFEGGIRLLGYDLSPTVARPGETLSLALYWQAEAPIPVSYTVFTQLLDAEGRYVTGWDNPPCHGTCPTPTWQPGEIIRDEYRLSLPADRPTGSYVLQAGWYEPETGRRLLTEHDDGHREDRVILATIVVR